MRMRTLFVCAVLMMPPILSAQTAERSRTEGIKETERFIKSGGETTEAVQNAKLQIRKTLDAYNALVTQPSKNMKGDYKKLMKSADAMQDRVMEARHKVDEMQTAGDAYFAGRAGTVKNIQDPELQKRAQGRLDESHKQFGAVLTSLREAAQTLEPFRRSLSDQITYLGSDLTPSAMTSLKPNAEKVNDRGSKVFADTDHAVGTATAYFDGLRSAES